MGHNLDVIKDYLKGMDSTIYDDVVLSAGFSSMIDDEDFVTKLACDDNTVRRGQDCIIYRRIKFGEFYIYYKSTSKEAVQELFRSDIEFKEYMKEKEKVDVIISTI